MSLLPRATRSLQRIGAVPVRPLFTREHTSHTAPPAEGSAQSGPDAESVGTGDTGSEEVEREEEKDEVEMWNPNAPAGPEWNGPRGYEPTKHGDWAQKGRVSDF